MSFNDPGRSFTAGGGFMNTSQVNSPASKKKNVRRVQSIVPVVIRQINECVEEDFKLFGKQVQIIKIVGILRACELTSTKANYKIEDHTGEMDAIWWLENSEDSTANLPLVKEGSYVKVFGSLRRGEDGKRFLMVLKMFLVEDANVITSHLLRVICVRLAAEAKSQNKESVLPKNANTSALPSMSFVDNGMDDSRKMSLSVIQEKVFKILKTCESAVGMNRTTIMKQFNADQRRDANNALEFLVKEGHIYSTIDNDHFTVTD